MKGVFCDKDLLENSILHVLRNVRKHHDPAWNGPHTVKFERLGIDRFEGYAVIAIKNDGTRESERPGHGYVDQNKDLKAFKCKLTGRSLGDDIWSYQAELVLRLIEGESGENENGR